MFAVVITEKGGAQRRLDFDKNEVTIGRVQGNDIILPKGNVSKRHSRIVLKDNRFIVVDLKSTNGTYVNGRKITSPLVVKSGDKIYIGDFILTLEEGAGAGGFDAAQPSPAPGGPPPMPGPPGMTAPPMSGPPMPGPPPMGPPMPGPPPAAPPPIASQRPSAPPPLPPRPAPAPMPAPAPTPAHMSPAPMAPPPMPAGPPPMPAPAPPMPAPAPQMPAPAPPMPAPQMPAPAPQMPAPAPPMPAPQMPAPAPPMPAPQMPAPAPPAPAPMPAHSAPPAPAPMPHHGAPPPMPMAGGAAERFPLDEEPAGMDDHAPSPRVVSAAQSAPAPMPPAPIAAAPMAPAHAAPAAHAPLGHAPAPSPPRGAQAALSTVVAQAARSFNPYEVTAPAGEGDPRRDAARRAVEGALEAAARGGASFDRDAIGHAALEELVGLGALGALIADASAHAVVVAGPDAVAVDRGQGLAPADACFSSSEALSVIVGRLVTVGGGYFDRGKATHEGSLPEGVHFTALLPPIAVGGPIVELRRTQRASLGGEQLVSRGMLSNEILELLRRASRGRRTVVVVGPSDAGVAQLVSAVAGLASGERLLAIEEVPRLALDGAVRLTAGPGATLEDVIRQGGRMHADRVVIDGVRGKETLAALLTAASRSGSVVGVHSASGGDALDHLGALARLGGATSEALASLLPSVVHVIVRVGRGGDGRARVESLAEVRRGGSGAQLVELFGANFAPTGQSPSF